MAARTKSEATKTKSGTEKKSPIYRKRYDALKSEIENALGLSEEWLAIAADGLSDELSIPERDGYAPEEFEKKGKWVLDELKSLDKPFRVINGNQRVELDAERCLIVLAWAECLNAEYHLETEGKVYGYGTSDLRWQGNHCIENRMRIGVCSALAAEWYMNQANSMNALNALEQIKILFKEQIVPQLAELEAAEQKQVAESKAKAEAKAIAEAKAMAEAKALLDKKNKPTSYLQLIE